MECQLMPVYFMISMSFVTILEFGGHIEFNLSCDAEIYKHWKFNLTLLERNDQ